MDNWGTIVYLDLANDLVEYVCVYQRTCAIIFSGELECKAGQLEMVVCWGTFASEKQNHKTYPSVLCSPFAKRFAFASSSFDSSILGSLLLGPYSF